MGRDPRGHHCLAGSAPLLVTEAVHSHQIGQVDVVGPLERDKRVASVSAVVCLSAIFVQLQLLPAHLVIVQLGVGGELFTVPIVHQVLVTCGEKLLIELHLLCVVRCSI